MFTSSSTLVSCTNAAYVFDKNVEQTVHPIAEYH